MKRMEFLIRENGGIHGALNLQRVAREVFEEKIVTKFCNDAKIVPTLCWIPCSNQACYYCCSSNCCVISYWNCHFVNYQLPLCLMLTYLARACLCGTFSAPRIHSNKTIGASINNHIHKVLWAKLLTALNLYCMLLDWDWRFLKQMGLSLLFL
jgi:hypothetical protein